MFGVIAVDNIGHEEGEVCNRRGCQGIIAESERRDCSCHISPPCSNCIEDRSYCPDCEWAAKDDVIINDYVVNVNKATDTYRFWEPRPLDPTKIDYRNLPHSNSSMIKEGVYPLTATREEVLKKVNGTFGGRFEYFRDGKFKFIAYTD